MIVQIPKLTPWIVACSWVATYTVEAHSNQGLVDVDYSPANSRVYLGSPSILVLDGGRRLLCSHDTFYGGDTTYMLESTNGGQNWSQISTVEGQYWSSLFEWQGATYLLGTTNGQRDAGIAISRSHDQGRTWQHAVIKLPPAGCSFATGSVPVIFRGGFAYRGMELWCGDYLAWPQGYEALLMYANASKDLLNPDNWELTSSFPFSRDLLPEWMPDPIVSGGYLEGNAVPMIDGTIGLLLRCRVYNLQSQEYTLQYSCLFKLSSSPGTGSVGNPLVLDWQGFVSMPGGGNKFSVRFDAQSQLYLSMTNPSIDRYGTNADARNILVLAYSPNLIDWRIATTVLRPNDGLSWDASLWFTGYQYVDWAIDGKDLVMVIRTAYDGAHSFHDSNRIAFKRLIDYQKYLPVPSSVPIASA